MAFEIISVRATYIKPDGVTPASGEVTFIATGTMRDTLDNVSIAPTEIVAILDGEGSIAVDLAATDGAYTTPKGVTYEVTERIDDSNENKFFITVSETTEYSSGILDLADIAPNIPTITTYTYATKEYVDTHLGTTAAAIEFSPTDEISSTTVQGAIEEVRFKSKYVHTQASAATQWNIQHNLKFYPNVTIVDSGENYVVGDIQYLDWNNLVVTFTHSFAGKAYLS